MNPFSIFAVLYMTAVILEMSEGWEDPGFTFFFLLVAVGKVLTGMTRVKFLGFLILTTAYFLIFLFPEVANHVNLIIYCNIVMVLTVAYAYLRHRDSVTDDEYFEMIRPVLRVSLILVYFLAGFHKLNEDYLNPEVSCAADRFSMLVSLMQKGILGVPVGLVLSALGLFILYRLIRGGRFGAPGERVFTLLVVLLVGAVLCGVLIVLLEAQFDNAAALRSIGLATGALIVLWELIGSLMLAVPRYQAVMVPFSLAMHAVLATVGFVDFGALALSLLFTFVPSSYYQVLTTHANLRFSGLLVHRVHVYFSINIIGGVLSGIDVHIYHFFNSVFFTGMLFNLAVLIFIWPILATIFSPSPDRFGVACLSLTEKCPCSCTYFLYYSSYLE